MEPLEEGQSLYLHVPFCRKRCGYCAFHSCDQGTEELKSLWVKTLLREWELRQEEIRRLPLRTVYFGGGTPSELQADHWRTLLRGLALSSYPRSGVSDLQFITVEANPGSLTEEKIDLWQEAGIRRLSLGVQSFYDQILARSGRMGGREETLKALALIQRRWTGPWNLDLMTGLPSQTPRHLHEDLVIALDSGCNHLALYDLIVEEGTPLADRLERGETLPREENRHRAWLEARDFLRTQGWEDYEVSNFCRPGGESQHNLTYWESRPWLGFGPGASGFQPGPQGWVRRENGSSWEWVSGPQLWGPGTEEVLDLSSLVLDVLLSGLRLKKGIEKLRFYRLTGIDPQDLWRGISPQDRVWYREDETSWGLTPQGRDQMDRLLVRMDLSWIKGSERPR